MATQPLISICIPSYNSERFIACTLESVLGQSFTDFEIIIVDDKSTDGTVSVIRSFSDARIRLIQNESNLGIGGNWNKVLSCAEGKYVKLLCGDDVIYPGCLARQVGALESPANVAVVLAVCGSNVIAADNRIILRRRFRLPAGVISGGKLIRKSIRWGSNLIGEPAVGLFRKQALSKEGISQSSNPYLIDLSLWADLLKQGDAFIDSECLAGFRISGQAASARIGSRQAAYFRSFIRTIRRDQFYRANMLDSMLGNVLSFQWCLLRNMFINSL
jgi:glycosyltransferase involved in cell wall biosynthesis